MAERFYRLNKKAASIAATIRLVTLVIQQEDYAGRVARRLW
jgi:hypothetical protein